MFVSPGRVEPHLNRRFVGAFQPTVLGAVTVTAFALFAISLSGLIELPVRDLLGCAVGLAAVIAVSQIANIRRGDAMLGLTAAVHLIVVSRGSLGWWPTLFGGWTNTVVTVLAIPAFLGVGVVGISVMSPYLRDHTARRPAMMLIVGVISGWWTILAFTVLAPSTQDSLRTPALTAASVSCAVWVGGHVLLFHRRRNLDRTVMILGLAAFSYFLGDIYGVLVAQWHMTPMFRILTCGLFGLAALRSQGDTRRPVISAAAILRPQERDLAIFAVIAPMALSIVPLLAWVVQAGDSSASWFPPLWVGSTLLVVLCLTLALINRKPELLAFEPPLPEPDQRRLHFQPITRSSDGAIIGAEALFRVLEPSGVRSGGSIFEELMGSSKLVELTDWIIDEALREGQQFLGAIDDPDAFVSFNMSPQEFTSPTLIERVDDALERSGCTADGFMIEVTELAFLHASDEVQERVRMLQDRGFLIALDDFGSGYASLHSIVEVDFDLIKIDRSIIVSSAQPRGEDLLRRTIELLSGAGLLVLAEGVEDRAQTELVRRQKPHYVQGYAIGRPMPIDSLVAHVTSTPVTHTHQFADN